VKILETLEKQFRRSRRDYDKRKAVTESRVAEWRWATKPFWNINPLYFEIHASRPGRPLKQEPANRAGKSCIGLDDLGRVVVEREYDKFGPEETFYDWEKNPVEIACYRAYRDAEPINLHVAKFVRDRLSLLVKTATGGASVEKYQWKDDRLESITIRYAPRDGKTLCGLAPYQTIRAAYSKDGSPKNIWIDWAGSEDSDSYTELVFRSRVKPVELNLRKDAASIRRVIETAVTRYAALHRKNPLANPPVSRFDIIYSLGDTHSTPWVFVNICAKPGSEPGDSPTHPDLGKLYKRNWLPAVQAVRNDLKVPVTRPDGKTVDCNDAKLESAIGEFLVGQLTLAREEGVFRSLPVSARCELGVENPMTGAFGWPKYKDRGKENLL
jgi:hypothetical protein